MIKPNTIWLSEQNVLFRLLAVLPDEDDKWKPSGEQRLTCYAIKCYPKGEDDGKTIDSVALPLEEWQANYFPCPTK